MSNLIERAKVNTIKLLCDVYPENLNAILSYCDEVHPNLDPDFTPNQLIENGEGEKVLLFLIRELQDV